jgi:biotin carboxyl carrier protein
LEGKYAVAFEGEKATVNGKLFDFSVKEGIEAKATSSEGTPIKAALPGNVLKVLVSEGDSIAEGDVIAVVEAMKMETEIKSPVSGTVNSVEIEVGNKVQAGQVLVTVG